MTDSPSSLIETARVEHRLAPYEDGSGFEYVVRIIRRFSKETELHQIDVEIESGGDVICIKQDHWESLKATVDHHLTSMAEVEDSL
jgi:hypothetical protein